jgi:hypothetical protein
MALMAASLGGCASSGVNDLLGVSKNSPDESQIRTTQSLSMPPDLQLRAPSGAVEEDGQLASAAAPSTTAPPADATVEAAPGQEQQVASAAPVPQTAATAAAPSATVDPYEKYNISKTKADGTPKSQEELFAELRAAKLAEKRRANPNYGTIFNIGDLFKDG